MKRFVLKITSLGLALLVLFSTLSISVEKHFCGDFLVDISYFGNAKSCFEQFKNDACDVNKEIKKKDCCSDETHHIEGQDELKTDFDKLTLLKQQFVAAYLVSEYFLVSTPVKQLVVPKKYTPPKISPNVQVLFQIFII